MHVCVCAAGCRWNAVLGMFFVLGVGSLLPWNFFMNAQQVDTILVTTVFMLREGMEHW